MMSIMLCTNWVCVGTLEDHEWLSESTITQHVEDVMGMELDFEIGIPCDRYNGACCGFQHLQGCMEHWKQNLKIRSTTKLSTCRSRHNFRTIWMRAHTEIVHVGIGGKGPTQNTQKVWSKQGDGRMDDERES